jgi:hypothetical protein
MELNHDAAAAATGAAPEAHRYARWLELGTRAGMLVLLALFAAMLAGVLPPAVSPARLAEVWMLPTAQMLEATGTRAGWAWLALLPHGDALSVLAIAVLATLSVPCLLAVAPVFAARGERVYVAIILVEVAVILLAASGLIGAGH